MTDVAGQPPAASRGPEDVRRVLAERISAGRLRPGQRLGAERALAAELGVSRATGARPEDVERQAAQQMVTGRFSRPDEVADLVLILASDRTANVTGADITIDGGLVPTW